MFVKNDALTVFRGRSLRMNSFVNSIVNIAIYLSKGLSSNVLGSP